MNKKSSLGYRMHSKEKPFHSNPAFRGLYPANKKKKVTNSYRGVASEGAGDRLPFPHQKSGRGQMGKKEGKKRWGKGRKRERKKRKGEGKWKTRTKKDKEKETRMKKENIWKWYWILPKSNHQIPRNQYQYSKIFPLSPHPPSDHWPYAHKRILRADALTGSSLILLPPPHTHTQGWLHHWSRTIFCLIARSGSKLWLNLHNVYQYNMNKPAYYFYLTEFWSETFIIIS